MALTTPTGDELTIGTRVRYNGRTGRPFAVRHTDLRPAIEARVAELDAQAKSAATTEADTLPVGGEDRG